MSPPTPTGPTRAETSTRRAVLNTVRGSAGNLVEWYDVYVYTVFANYFEGQFFERTHLAVVLADTGQRKGGITA